MLERQLIACANVFPQMTSVYTWKEKIEEEDEVVMLLKTTEEAFSSIKQVILDNHPYDCPAIFQLDIADGHDEFLNWINQKVLVH